MNVDFNSPALGYRCLFEKWAVLRLLIGQKIAKYDFQKKVVEVTREVENYCIDIREYKLDKNDGEIGYDDTTCSSLPFQRKYGDLRTNERHLGHVLEMFGFELKYVDQLR